MTARTPARFVFLFLALAAPLAAQMTESPQTVAPGRVLLEMDGLSLAFGRADSAGNTYDAVAIASTLVSVGLTSRCDVQMGIDVFLRERIKSGTRRESHSGFGDISFRTKWAFWRDAELGAAALIPYVRLPSSSGGVGTEKVEAGVILPWERSLAGGFFASAMLQWDAVQNDDANGYDAVWSATACLQRNLTEEIGIYGEAAVEFPSATFSRSSALIGAGATWQLTRRLQLDYQLLRGIGRHAVAWAHVLRLNWSW